ncbi:hypothetical protein [Clostridium cochlearium]|uniref:hypothetical protein n=1 Tax=Clostridium cochlearium TaxID=1494 RepID=UPI0017A341B8|nr:hypothetical protein [Clostridium cochlearium]NMA58716.1 hypothetical protein [Clostridium cochlearium]
MTETNKIIEICRMKLLEFVKNWNSIISLDMLIDIYNEIRFSGMNENEVKQKYLKILYNLKESNGLHTILEEGDRIAMKSLLDEFLKVKYNKENYYLSEECFSKLSLDEFYQILIEVKYLKERENTINVSKI